MRWIAVPIVLLTFAVPLPAEELRGKVVHIADGDTITVLDAHKTQHKIRLEGIDAPEHNQAFGNKSKARITEKIAGKEVVVIWKSQDRYQRILGDVYLGNRHVNLEMIQDGFAWHYKHYSKSKELTEAEVEARRAKRGLWVDKNPMPPWDFRLAEREKREKK